VNQQTLGAIVRELGELLPGRFFGKIFQLSPYSLAIDFGVREQGFLFISVEPALPGLYLINRRTRELEKASAPLSPFAQAMRATFSGGSVSAIALDEYDRVVRFSFDVQNELGDSQRPILVAQLTGRSANLFILDGDGKIVRAWRSPQGEGQQAGDLYCPPVSKGRHTSQEPEFSIAGSISMSEAVDKHYQRLAVADEFDRLANTVLAGLRKEITKRKKLQTNLKNDLASHGNPDEHKRAGDLLLANIGTAKRAGDKVTVTDYFSDDTPLIELDVAEHLTLQEAAAAYFSRYTKAKRAIEEISLRVVQLDEELTELAKRRSTVEAAIANRDLAALRGYIELKTSPSRSGKKQEAPQALTGMRRYSSSDGYEVIVGRSARDNDRLTFRVARPNDLWLHAGDYPGSHVIVRNSSREEIPHRTIIEAAQLAAKFSQAGNDSKVTIHYTRRKFLSKPKGAAAGLVRMTNFKTITVEPGENLERIK
jgi:predicted ribosome quality control (RQC) complex YloA/Tae2 family protein